MKISELRKRLEKIETVHGDLNVFIEDSLLSKYKITVDIAGSTSLILSKETMFEKGETDD